MKKLTIHDKIHLAGFKSITEYAKKIKKSRGTIYRWGLDESKDDAQLCIKHLDALLRIRQLEADIDVITH
jgi:hypothetical protein